MVLVLSSVFPVFFKRCYWSKVFPPKWKSIFFVSAKICVNLALYTQFLEPAPK